MAKKFSVTLAKASHAPHALKSAAPMKAGDTAPTEYVLLDNENGTVTVLGVTAGGNHVDISAVATLAVTSDNTATVTADPPAGMTCKLVAAGPLGTANVTLAVTFNDGSAGPFSVSLPCTVKAGPVSGVIVELGTPVPN